MSENASKYVTQEQLDESMKALEKKFKKLNAPPRAPREPSEFNIFMKDQMAKVKKENPTIGNKDAFKECAKNWNKTKEAKKEDSSKKE